MKTTPFTKYHIENGARMAEFAGYNMPIEFSGINDEHHTVREKAGVFDVSHMGEIWVKGPRAIDFLQHVTSNNVAALYDGKIQYSCLPNGRGGIVDDILVYRINAETFLLVVNAANTDKDWKHLCKEGEAFGVRKQMLNISSITPLSKPKWPAFRMPLFRRPVIPVQVAAKFMWPTKMLTRCGQLSGKQVPTWD